MSGTRTKVFQIAAKVFLPLLALMFTATIASAHEIPKPCDFVTGGGWVPQTSPTALKTSNGKANFGLVAGCKHHAFWGHLNFIDHTNKLHVNSTSIVSYTMIVGQSLRRDFCGTARTNLYGDVKFHVVVVDNGEPGKHDRFGISLSNGYMLHTRYLGGGNIQLHKPNPSTTPPATFTECDKLAPNPFK
ncbi:MAG: hypothetical protein JWO13_251 [Acidobacteriales bacterium]|nr:hypothetical protein [Terriglobales bacterium]